MLCKLLEVLCTLLEVKVHKVGVNFGVLMDEDIAEGLCAQETRAEGLRDDLPFHKEEESITLVPERPPVLGDNEEA